MRKKTSPSPAVIRRKRQSAKSSPAKKLSLPNEVKNLEQRWWKVLMDRPKKGFKYIWHKGRQFISAPVFLARWLRHKCLGWILAVLLCLGLGYGGLWVWVSVLPGLNGAIQFEVQRGDSLAGVTVDLVSRGEMPYPDWVHLWARLHGGDRNLKPGEYVFNERPSVRVLVQRLVQGNVQLVRMTIPEGFNLREIAQQFGDKGITTKTEFLRLAYDATFIASLGLPFEQSPLSLEGLLLPETYYFTVDSSAELVLRSMAREFLRQARFIFRQPSPNNLSSYQVIILASIVEKETGNVKERHLISSVFHNRLGKDIKLQTDPTVIYGLTNFDGNIKRSHLRAWTPYNTYIIKGLPPTPIASPGLASLRSVLEPEESDYLYFVSKGDGSHFFSKDFATHSKAVYRYQIRRPKR